MRLLSSLIIANKSKPALAKGSSRIVRQPDDISFSIWAQDVIKRGGNLKDALSIIEERILKTSSTTPSTYASKTSLLNSAIDMCGHAGNLQEASRILSLMEAKGIHKDERTICSLINAVATFSKPLPKHIAVLNENENDNNDEESSTLLSPFKEPKNKTEAMRLAITIYSKFLQSVKKSTGLGIPTSSSILFNCLLKAVWRCDMAPLILPSIFPPPSSTTVISKQEVDITTFTTAILAYNSAIRDSQRSEEEKREFLSIAFEYFTSYKGKVDTALVMSILLCIKGRLWGMSGIKDGLSSVSVPLSDPESKMEKFKISRFLNENITPIIEDLFPLGLPINTLNTFLSIQGRLKGCGEVMSPKLREMIWNNIKSCESIKKSSSIDPETITLLGYVELRYKECPMTILDSIDQAKKIGGLHISLPIIKLYFLASLNLLNQGKSMTSSPIDRCWKMFEQIVLSPQTQPNAFLRSKDFVLLDSHCVRILIDIIKRDSSDLRGGRLRSIKLWLKLLPTMDEGDGKCTKKTLLLNLEKINL